MSNMVVMKKIRGSIGSWEAEVPYSDGTRETLPCVHKHYWRSGYYHEPAEKFSNHARLERHAALISRTGRVVLTIDEVDESRQQPIVKRKPNGYVGVFSVADVVFDAADGLRFRFVDRFPEC